MLDLLLSLRYSLSLSWSEATELVKRQMDGRHSPLHASTQSSLQALPSTAYLFSFPPPPSLLPLLHISTRRFENASSLSERTENPALPRYGGI